MKRILLIISFVFIFCDFAMCYTNYYNPTSTYRNTYNPYRAPLSYSRYRNNLNNKKAIQRIQQRRKLNRARRIYNQVGSILNNTKYYPGTLTGYSVPVTQNVFSQVAPKNIFEKQLPSSPTCKQELFGNSSGDEIYFDDGRYYKNFNETNAKTGVTIIYD